MITATATVPTKVELKEIVIKVVDKELKLSLEEARQLRDILKEILGDDENKIIYVPTYPHYVPIYPYTYPYPVWTTDVTWSSNGYGTYSIKCNSANNNS